MRRIYVQILIKLLREAEYTAHIPTNSYNAVKIG